MQYLVRLVRFSAVIMAVGSMTVAAPSRAGAFPDRPVTIIVAAAAGGSSDITARALAAGLQQRWGKAVVVENRAGANGLIAAQTLMKAVPDGYTLMLGSIGQMMINPIEHGPRYEPAKAYTMIGQVSKTYMVMVTAPGSPYNNLGEYIEYERQHPGQGTFSSSGVGSLMHIAGEVIKHQSGVNLTHVPYKGEAPALVDLMAGRVAAGFVVAGTAVPLVHTGKLKALAISDSKRSAELPDVPTAIEQGYPVDMPVWNGIVGPNKMDSQRVGQINHDMNEVLKSRAFQAQMRKIGISAAPTTSREFTRYVNDQSRLWKDVIKKSGITFH